MKSDRWLSHAEDLALAARGTSIALRDQFWFDVMVAFIASLNGNAEDHIGYFDTADDDIARALRELTLPVEEGFRLAIEDGQIVGVLGIEADPEIGRSWIYGPLVRHPLWQAVADQLYAAALPAIPPGIGRQQIFCDGLNRNCRDFAARHGFDLLNESAIMTLSRADLTHVPLASAAPIDEAYYEQFRSSHPRLMPNTYLTAQQILDRLGIDSHLLMATQEGELVGYVYFQAGPGVTEGYIDFVAVAETARERGIGAQLVAAAAHSAFGWPDIELVRLTVNMSNAPALRLYERLGFPRERTMMGFVRNTASQQ
jgi:ribosomal protein S18 acetylase RimI-like enzyme